MSKRRDQKREQGIARRDAATPPAMVPPAADRRDVWAQHSWILFPLATAIYYVWFFELPLPSLAATTGAAWPRYQIFEFLRFPDLIGERWTGADGQWALADRLPLLLVAGGILLASGAAGWLLLWAFGADGGFARLERVVFSLAVGLNVTSLYVLGIGLAGWLHHRFVFVVPGVAAVAVACALWFRSWLNPDAADTAADETAKRFPGDLALGVVCLVLAVPFVKAVLLGGMLPPVDFDVREYHLEVPKEFYERGRIDFLPHNIYGNMALGTEMHSLLGMVLLGDWGLGALAGKLVQAAFVPLAGLAILAAGWRLFSFSAGALGALVYVSIPWIGHVATAGLVEAGSAFYLFTALYAVLLWSQALGTDLQRVRGHLQENRKVGGCLGLEQDAKPQMAHWGTLRVAPGTQLKRTDFAGATGQFSRGRLLLAGFLAGSAVAAKYPAALFVLLPLAAAVTWLAVRQFDLAAGAKAGAIFLLAALLACGPWFAKNWALTGNPTYPLLYEAFDGKTRTPENNAQWQRAHRPPNYSPADAAARVVDLAGRSEWLSPLVWPLALLALIESRHRRRLGWLLGYVGFVFAAWWLATHRIDRFWVPALPVVALVAGAAATAATSLARRVMLTVVLLPGLTYCLLVMVTGAASYNRYLVPLTLLRLDPLRVASWHLTLNQQVPPGQGVLAVGDAEVFDLERPVLYNTVFDPSIFESIVRADDGGLRSAEQIRARLGGISRVYVHWGEIARYRSPGNYGFSDFVQPELFERLVAEGVLAPVNEDFRQVNVQVFTVLHTAPKPAARR